MSIEGSVHAVSPYSCSSMSLGSFYRDRSLHVSCFFFLTLSFILAFFLLALTHNPRLFGSEIFSRPIERLGPFVDLGYCVPDRCCIII